MSMFFDLTIANADSAPIATICNQINMGEALEELATEHVTNQFSVEECDAIDLKANDIQKRMDSNDWPNREELVEVYLNGKVVAHLWVLVIIDSNA